MVRLQLADGTASAPVTISVEPKVTAKIAFKVIGGRPYFVITGKVSPGLKGGEVRLVFDRDPVRGVKGGTVHKLNGAGMYRYELPLPARHRYVIAHVEVPASIDWLKGSSNKVAWEWM